MEPGQRSSYLSLSYPHDFCDASTEDMTTPDNVLKPEISEPETAVENAENLAEATIVEMPDADRAAASLEVGSEEFLALLKHRIKFSVGQEWGTNLSHKQLHTAISLAV